MTASNSDNNRITSCAWIAGYEQENDAPPAFPVGAFDEERDDGCSSVQIPSGDPNLQFPSSTSRLSTLDAIRLASLDKMSTSRTSSIGSCSSQTKATTYDFLQDIMAKGRAKMEASQRISTDELLTNMVMGDDNVEPSLSPEHEQQVAAAPVGYSKPIAQMQAMHEAQSRSNKRKTKTTKKTSLEREYVEELQDLDILSERGGLGNHHYGNQRYRKLIEGLKSHYESLDEKTAKTALARKIVAYIKSYGGRFLKKDEATGQRYVMTDQEARKKTSQALREKKVLKWTNVDVEDFVPL